MSVGRVDLSSRIVYWFFVPDNSFYFYLNKYLKTNILHYREHTPDHYWIYDPVNILLMMGYFCG